MRIHILGICGTLMGSIAMLAREAGHVVSGTDQNVYPPMSTQLENADIALNSPYAEDSIPSDVELIIVGNAGLPRGNPAIEAMLDLRTPYISGAEWLGRYLLPNRWVIAVSGTHGKTTTTSMVAWILQHAGMNPGYLVGGIPANFGQSATLGEDPFFVIEADEYDTSYFDHQSKFLHYRPQTLVINNLEYDHADIFEDLDAIQDQFHLLLRRIPGSGLIIIPGQDQNVHDLITRGCWSSTQTFGTRDADVTAGDVAPDGSSFNICITDEVQGRVDWPLTGIHNVHNALAAVSAARHAGVPPSHACAALCEFKGVKRRMELIHRSASVSIYDDFAHHPTAIKHTLEGLRAKVGGETILAVIEPASHTMRLGTHAGSLRTAVSAADRVLWYRSKDVGWDMDRNLQEEGSEVIDNLDGLLSRCVALASGAGSMHIVIMSNSGFGGFHKKLLGAL